MSRLPRPPLMQPLMLPRSVLTHPLPQFKVPLHTWPILLMLLLPRPTLKLPSWLPTPEFTLALPLSKCLQHTWLTLLMLQLPRLTLLLLMPLLRLVSTLLLLPNQLKPCQHQLSQPTQLHSTVVSTTVTIHTLLDTMVATIHMLDMEALTHMPLLLHTPTLLLQSPLPKLLPNYKKGIRNFVHRLGHFQIT